MKTLLLSGIKKSLNPEKEILIADENYIYIQDKDTNRIKALFQKAGHRYVQIDLINIVNEISTKLAPQINIETVLKELILLHSHPQEIMELKDRLLDKGYAVPISEAPRCYSLMIGGKKGRPYEFNIVG